MPCKYAVSHTTFELYLCSLFTKKLIWTTLLIKMFSYPSKPLDDEAPFIDRISFLTNKNLVT